MSPIPSLTKSAPSALTGQKGTLYFLHIPLLIFLFALVGFGLLVVRSAIAGSEDYSISRQIMGVGVGLVLMVVFWRFDYRLFSSWIIPLLIIVVFALLSPHFPIIGYSAKGATSWVQIAGLRFQPGEPSKFICILMIAAVVAQYRGSIISGKEYLKVLGISAIPFLCIMTQPDLGSGLVIIIIAATILFVGGANRKWLLLTIAVAILAIAGILALDPVLDAKMGEDVFLKDYQMNRLLVFVNPDLDPTGAGYNLEQAKIAIGSGGFSGKGLGNGTQSALGFLPEAPTDFIFCVIGEELGFLGASFLLLLYLGLFACAFNIARRSCNLYGSLLVAGIMGMWAFQILENIGMCCGLMPITGIPLPFISFGSSFMLTNFMSVGVMLSVWTHRFDKIS